MSYSQGNAKRRPPHTAQVVAGAALLSGAAALAWAGLIERNWFALRSFTVPCLPPGSDPIRVLHLSDLHLMPGQNRKIEWVRQLSDLQPDLVINTGDNISSADSVGPILHAFDEILDVPGVFVLGSNDYFEPAKRNPFRYFLADARPTSQQHPTQRRLPVEDMIAGMQRGGWVHLHNSQASFEVAGVPFEFNGVDDPHLNLDVFTPFAQPPTPEVARIGVAHAPYQRILNALVRDGSDALIAGHTHGGQLRVPLYGALTSNCDIDNKRARGLSSWAIQAETAQNDAQFAQEPGVPRDTYPRTVAGAVPHRLQTYQSGTSAPLHVCAGLGTSPYAPFRFACRPEAALLQFTARTAK